MTIPEVFAAQWEATGGDVVTCIRAVLDADALMKRRGPVRALVAEESQREKASRIVMSVARELGTTLAEMRGPSRVRVVAEPRMFAMLMVRELLNLSFPVIGRVFGGRDHSTIIAGCTVARARLAGRPDLAARLRRVAWLAIQPEVQAKEAA